MHAEVAVKAERDQNRGDDNVEDRPDDITSPQRLPSCVTRPFSFWFSL
jgi:hypothetical protein